MIAGWASTYAHPLPRRSHDQSRPEISVAVRSTTPEEPEPRRRSSSDATPRQTPAPGPRILPSPTNTNHDPNHNILVTPLSDAAPSSAATSSRRLGFFAEKISSSLSVSSHSTAQKSASNHSQLLHPHSHTRAESSLTAREQTSSPLPMASTSHMSSSSKVHTSPSKAVYGRTYDSKLVSKEMHRLGNLSHVPNLPSSLSPTPSSSSTLVTTSSSTPSASLSTSTTTDPWATLHVHVLPLFNGEPLRIPIEDLNVLVKQHIEKVIPSAPSKALATLENHTSELISSGMVTLNAKLSGVDDDKLVSRVVEIWNFFWDQVLPYIEGVLLPLQTDALLSSLYRTPKTHRAASPGRQVSKGSISTTSNLSIHTSNHIDVRLVALRSFRDRIILPISSRLYMRFSNKQDLQERSSHHQPRLQQMLLVLASQGRKRPPAFTLSTPPPQPTAGEAAVMDLLRVIRSPGSFSDRLRSPNPRAIHGSLAHPATFLSGAIPRDRRGRIAQKKKKGKSGTIMAGSGGEENDTLDDGIETPRNGFGGFTSDAEREQELLEALRSPDPEGGSDTRMSMGGWGLGAGNEDSGKQAEEDDDEPLDWDQAQAVVERMIGMNSNQPFEDIHRRGAT